MTRASRPPTSAFVAEREAWDWRSFGRPGAVWRGRWRTPCGDIAGMLNFELAGRVTHARAAFFDAMLRNLVVKGADTP